MEQRKEDWLRATAGSVGGTAAYDATARQKNGTYTAKRKNKMAELLIERLEGKRTVIPVSKEMQWGVDNEEGGRNRYSFENGVIVQEVGLIKHPAILWSHYSPDGLVDDDGLIEIKCPTTSTHLTTLVTEQIPENYITQMQWGMAVSGRDWCDYVSFDPRIPNAKAQYFQKRVYRDNSLIDTLEDEITKFINELDDMVARFVDKYGEIDVERIAA